MTIRKCNIKEVATLLAIVLIMATGCTNNADNQVKQQGMRTQQVNNNNPPKVDNRIQIANQAAEKIVKLNSVKQANVVVTEKNAYVAVLVDTPQGELSHELEEQIAQQVRSSDSNIQNVYVSTNPEFVDRINRYVTDVREGRPVSGFFEEFTEIVKRIFPKAR
ncbi:YhcN/YlaJ family sporulation lipoprotein [Paenibacillus agricola]|uniref:YhcN/YlaJ family sporulation lipoprotein n=1 Tax=Paenibacillus agricola TaxID=2716264 RepID=A0ABX0JIR8_9BACL|nr:YhcN/YlaJ family sporulation lipoprotein [Paenibacillus agricola]NHN35365.1 YhcN/YlaJ family sporulation lipoprotein [Paenibacillus agricola]